MHHLHKRKRSKRNTKLILFFDKLVYVVGIFGWIMTLPQLFNIWVLKNASGVSPFTWGTFAFISLVWVCYGFLHKDKHLVLIYSGWLIIDILIVIGILLF